MLYLGILLDNCVNVEVEYVDPIQLLLSEIET